MENEKRHRDINAGMSGPAYAPVEAGRSVWDVRVHESAPPRPRQLLPPPVRFTGRDRELDELDEILRAGPPVVVVVTGPGGVGKTALALHWAHRVSDRFPDGQLYVDLAGFSATGPVDPGEALGSFLRALGVPPERVPVGLAEQAALYRSMTADRAMLIVLDNAYSAAQVRVLLPASRASAVVVTSRSRVIGLIPDGARIITVAPLPTRGATDLLASTAGKHRVVSEPDLTEQLVNMCGGFPIALCVAGARLATRPRWSVGRVAAELADEQRRLTNLSAPGGPSVQAAFDVSYRSLPAPAAALYRRLALHPGHEFGPGVAAAVTPDGEVGALDDLVEDNLLEELDENRYRFHDLLQLHARQCAAAEDSPQQQDTTLLEILEWYLSTAVAADLVMTPYRRRPYPYEFRTGTTAALSFDSRKEALSWLDTERANLIAAGKTALEREWWALAWHLADVMWPLLLYRKYHRNRLDIDRRGVDAARGWGNKWAEAVMLQRLGRVLTVFGEYQEGEHQLRAAQDLFHDQDDPLGVAGSQEFLALLYVETDRLAEAVHLFEQSLAAHRQLNAERNVGLDLINLGMVLPKQRRAEEAVEKLNEAHDIFRKIGNADPYNGARVMVALGDAYRQIGKLGQARSWAEQAARAMAELGSDFGAAEAFEVLAEIAISEGATTSAVEHLTRALQIFESLFSARAEHVRARLHALARE